MHLRNVEIFCDVVAHRSFSKAAEANYVSQSSASQAVHTLEKRLGSELIDRSKRPLQPTPAGRIYFDGCRSLLQSFRTLEDRIQQIQDKVSGRLRIAAIYSVGLLQIDRYLQQYSTLYRDVSVHVDYLHPDKVYERVLNDAADMGLVSFPRDGGEISSIPWQQQRMGLVVRPEDKLARCNGISVRELGGRNFVNFCPELTIRKQIDRWLKKARVSVNVVREFDNIENIKRAVEIGSGIAILPVPTVSRETKLGSLVAVAIDDVLWFRPLGVIHKRHKTLTIAASKFVELLLEDTKTSPNSDLFPTRKNGNQVKHENRRTNQSHDDRNQVGQR